MLWRNLDDISHVNSVINAQRVHHLQDLKSCLLPFILADLSVSLGSVPIKVSEMEAPWPGWGVGGGQGG